MECMIYTKQEQSVQIGKIALSVSWDRYNYIGMW